MITPIVSSMMYSTNRQAVLEAIPKRLSILWKAWDLRLTILVSLILQLILSILGNHRKYSRKTWIRVLLWSAYTAADSVAIFALGILSKDLSCKLEDKANVGHLDPNLELAMFWAQILLLHLGGPDSLTAYALEDNELWLRQLLGLVSQTGGAIYFLIQSWTGSRLSILSMLMFIAGLIKFGERTWVLRAASNQIRRKSVLKRHYDEIDVQYGDISRQLFECEYEYVNKDKEGYIVRVDNCPDARLSLDLSGFTNQSISDEEKFRTAYKLLLSVTKRLFEDFAFDPNVRNCIQVVFRNISFEDAFQINEIQLGMIYDLLYTKAPLLYSSSGLVLRLITSILICSSLVLFCLLDDKHKYSKIDLSITFLLLVVGVLLEIYATLLVLSSDWLLVWLSKRHKKISTMKALTSFPLLKTPRWSNIMSQYTLLSFIKKKKPLLSCGQVGSIGKWEHNKWNTQVTEDIREMIFRFFLEKVEQVETTGETPFTAPPSRRTIMEQEDDQHRASFDWEKFEDRIVTWSIVTDVSYYLIDRKSIPADLLLECKAIKRISRYMLYLLVELPSMISAQIGLMVASCEGITSKITSTCEHGKNKDKANLCQKLLQENLCVTPDSGNNDLVLYNAMTLVNKMDGVQLKVFRSGYRYFEEEEPDPENLRRKWEKIRHFWLETLGYAATRSKGYDHAQQLRSGGELLTHVWLLMAHFGLTQYFQVSGRKPVGRIIAK